MKAKYLLMVTLTVVGCSGTVNDLPYHWEDGMPRFEWVEPVVFQMNLERCRRATVCKAETLFDK